MKIKINLLLLLVLLPVACSSSADIRVDSGDSIPVYVVNYGFHTDLMIRTKDIPAGALPFSENLFRSTYVQMGWGDRDWIMAPADPGMCVVLKAVFLRTASAMRVERSDYPPDRIPGSVDVVQLRVAEGGFRGLLEYISGTLVRKPDGEVTELQHGEFSAYYATEPKYHMFNTCNVMTMRALERAGFPVSPWRSLTAGSAIGQARKYGILLRENGN